ncbi:hypothetical protein [Paenibacillus tianjinensis]|uniref:Uncharacterized protein n=1 Tax=Paenibacillus tianjinensis TaxID=2810347 RepID=A0ABX7LDW3_9BACL|nr:hypothetical protein [Paenibacillus tianjinensis]QSF46313.1 hypothetical protein JRJ22_06870 [Paenibacillus tianjinensis]
MGYITSFIALGLTFILFYFNAPYWCGKEMYKTSENGLWRWYYLFLSKIGHLLYILCESISKSLQKFVFSKLKLRADKSYPTLTVLINLITYIGAIFLLTFGYEKICDSFVISDDADVNTLIGGSEGFIGYIKEKISFIRIVFEVIANQGGHFTVTDLIRGVFVVAVMWLLLLLLNTLYFSIIYGFLKEKLKEVPLGEKLFGRKEEDSNEAAGAGEGQNLHSLLIQMKNAIRDWADTQTVINNISQYPKVLWVFIPLLFIFSSVMYLTGIYRASMKNTLLEILDSINLVNIAISFIFTYAGTKAVQKSGAYAVSVAPEAVKVRIQSISESAQRRVDVILRERERWAADHDTVQNVVNQGPRTANRQQQTPPPPSQQSRQQRQRQTPPQPQPAGPVPPMSLFDDEVQARRYLQDEFRSVIGDFDVREYTELVKWLSTFIPPTILRESNSFGTAKPLIVQVANFWLNDPNLLKSDLVDKINQLRRGA